MRNLIVRNVLTKCLCLALFTWPMILLACLETKELTSGQFTDNEKIKGPANADLELQSLLQESVLFSSLPGDMRRELFYPSGSSLMEPPDQWKQLYSALVIRSNFLADYRRFMLLFNTMSLNDSPQPNSSTFAGSPGEIADRYQKLLNDRHLKLQRQARFTELRALISNAEPNRLPEVVEMVTTELRSYETRWPNDPEVAGIRKLVSQKQLDVLTANLKEDLQKLDGQYSDFLRLHSVPRAKNFIEQCDLVNQKLTMIRARSPNDSDFTQQRTWLKIEDSLKERRAFVSDIAGLLDTFKSFLDESRVDDFFMNCSFIARNRSGAETNIIRSIAEDFCTSYLSKPPSFDLNYDKDVVVTDTQGTKSNLPRTRVYIYFKNGKSQWLQDGNPLENKAYNEFSALNDPDVKDFSVYDQQAQNERPNMSHLSIKSLEATERTRALYFYFSRYKLVERWNATTIREFVKACQNHKDSLGEIWVRLHKLSSVLDRYPEIFPTEKK